MAIIYKIKTAIREPLKKLLVLIFPEFYPLFFNQIDWNYIENTSLDCEINDLVKISGPYHIEKSKIGRGTYISTNSYISQAEIGQFCSIGPNFLCGWGIHPLNGISTHPIFYSDKKQNGYSFVEKSKITERKKIVIGNDVFIGANVTILDGVKVGDGAVLGAGTIVTKDVPPYAICAGSPGKIIKYRFTDEQINKLLDIQWWNWDLDKLKKVEESFFDLDHFTKENYNL